MNKKGFTLVELLGVIVILGIIALISIPPILNQMASSEQSIDEATLRVVYSAGSLYLDERQNNFVRNPGNVFCVQIEDLVADGKLDPALSDSSGNEIDASKYVKYTVTNSGTLTYELERFSGCDAGEIDGE